MSRPKRPKKGSPEAQESRQFDDFLKGRTFAPPPEVAEQMRKDDESLRRQTLRERALNDLYVFAVEVCGDAVLDAGFHGSIARFLEAGHSYPFPTEEAHYVFRNRAELPCASGQLDDERKVERPEKRRWAVELDGNFRGKYIGFRGEGKLKALLEPRGHIKTGMEARFVLWLQVKSIVETGSPKRYALCCERQKLAADILHAIKRTIEVNKKFHEVFPECVPDCFLHGEQGDKPKDLRWAQDAIELPGVHNLATKEASIACYGVSTGITGDHFDGIVFDDCVTRKNITTEDQIAKVRQFYEDAIFLLDPNGWALDVGTRWHFADAHGAILDGSLIGIDAVSLCFGTIDGDDDEPLYPEIQRGGKEHKPYGFTRKKIDLLLHGDAKKGTHAMPIEAFSSQYRNQPLEGKDSLFPRERWRFYDWQQHLKDVEKGRKVVQRFGLSDPAIKMDPARRTGDYAFACVIDCDVNGNWFIFDGRHGRFIIDELLEEYMDLQRKYEWTELGIEQGQLEDTLEFAIETKKLDLRVRKISGKWTRESKEMRLKRITGKQRIGKLLLPGDPNRSLKDQYWELAPWVQTMIEEGAKFPKGMYDDCIDTLGYGPDVIHAPIVEDPEDLPKGSPQTVMDLLERVDGERPSVNQILGSER